MHPSYSVILFTVASGAGYGLLALLGLFAFGDALPDGRGLGFAGLALALGAITFGLLASTVHLGHPERAWRALSQWRSSWLSREGALALLTYIPALGFALGWLATGTPEGVWAWLGLAAAAGAALTVASTGMIYATLKPIPAWCNRWVAPNYLALALMTGALLLNALLRLFSIDRPAVTWLAIAAALLAWTLKRAYWRHIDNAPVQTTPESATGLGTLGKVRQLMPPHSNPNFVMREMGYRIARKHAAKLRRIAVLCAYLLPLLLSALMAAGFSGIGAAVAACAAAVIAIGGVMIERWLFFAEARHVVMSYYGGAAEAA